MKTYDVLRQHQGDKMYMPGDTRKAAQGDVQHLINNGVLKEAKAEKPSSNKAVSSAPKNKSA